MQQILSKRTVRVNFVDVPVVALDCCNTQGVDVSLTVKLSKNRLLSINIQSELSSISIPRSVSIFYFNFVIAFIANSKFDFQIAPPPNSNNRITL